MPDQSEFIQEILNIIIPYTECIKYGTGFVIDIISMHVVKVGMTLTCKISTTKHALGHFLPILMKMSLKA